MPKHMCPDNPFLQSVYDVVRGIPGVQPIDGRTSTDISINSDVPTTEALLAALTKRFGEPTKNHPMLAAIEWRLGKNVIILPKAAQMKGRGLGDSLSAW